MEDTPSGVYIGPRDSEDDQSDIFVKCNETHILIEQFKGVRTLELSRDTGSYVLSLEKQILDGIRNAEIFTFSKNLDPTTSLRITNREVVQEMGDIRIWYRNCVGRWAPTRKGARLHYIHFTNLFLVIKDFLDN